MTPTEKQLLVELTRAVECLYGTQNALPCGEINQIRGAALIADYRSKHMDFYRNEFQPNRDELLKVEYVSRELEESE